MVLRALRCTIFFLCKIDPYSIIHLLVIQGLIGCECTGIIKVPLNRQIVFNRASIFCFNTFQVIDFQISEIDAGGVQVRHCSDVGLWQRKGIRAIVERYRRTSSKDIDVSRFRDIQPEYCLPGLAEVNSADISGGKVQAPGRRPVNGLVQCLISDIG